MSKEKAIIHINNVSKMIGSKRIGGMIMTREEAKKLLPIIQAFAEGKVIECKTKPSAIKGIDTPNKWTEIREIFFSGSLEYRIKPDSKYRPFKDAEECWQEMQEHQPFGWVKCKEDGSLGLITLIISEENIFINGIGCNSERTMRGYTFADGTPFGVKVEE